MDESRPHQPHDKLFKLGFSDPETAAAFLSDQFPAPLSKAIEWKNLELLSGSFIDEKLRARESDLLFSAPLAGRETLIYLLFEHQSTEDKWITLRLLRYMVSIWEKHRASTPEGLLPPILPVVLAQNDRAWSLCPDFRSLLDVPDDLADDFRSFLPDFAFRLVQLAHLPYEAIRGTPAGVVFLRVMKAERRGELLGAPVWDESLLARLPRELFEALVTYLCQADIDIEGIERKLMAIQSPELRNTAMTYAETLHQRGRFQGHLEGRLATLRNAVLTALELRFNAVPEGVAEAIRHLSDEEKLTGLHRLAIRCATLEEFADGL